MPPDLRISFVVALRDPEYGTKHGMNNLYRTQLFVENLIFLCDTHNLPAELIFVEWNPAKEGEFFERIEWPAGKGRVVVRWLAVPVKFHRRYDDAEHAPIFEFSAKNVGIRRAHADFILASNPDVLYSAELIRALAGQKLSAEHFYRVDRLDVGAMVSRELDIEERLERCARNVFVQHTQFGTVPPLLEGSATARRWRRLQLSAEYWSGKGLVHSPDGLHRNASGDFFMMKREHWWDVKGFVELPTHSHMDAIMCWQADSLGLKQVVLPAKLYHLDHGRTRCSGELETDWQEWQQRYRRCLEEEKVLVGNGDGWGLPDDDFPEIAWRVG